MWRILKLNIISTKTKYSSIVRHLASCCAILLFLVLTSFFIHSTYATSTIPMKEYSANSIFFYDPLTLAESCIPSKKNSSSICGNTAREKYWSALRKYFDEIHVAAMFGSIDHEGSFGPTLWQYNIVPAGSGAFASDKSWSQLYNCAKGNCPGGVGAFQITYELGWYLQQINAKNPDLIKYFQDPSYSLQGDTALEKIGETDFDRLIDQEIEIFLLDSRKSSVDGFKTTTTLDDATDFWTKVVENCNDCCGDADTDKSCGQLAPRRASAHKLYDEMKNSTCASSSSSSTSSSSSSSKTDSSSSKSTVPGKDITWIGDSYSVGANAKDLLPSGVDIGSGAINTPSSYIQDGKFVSSSNNGNPSCLSILQRLIDSNSLRPYLVFACGTNGGWSDSDIATFRDLINSTDTDAIVVNSKIPGNDYTDSNNRLKQMADSNDDISLADWVSVYKDEYFDSDPTKIHPRTDPGYEEWVGAINKALSSSKNSCATFQGDYPSYPQCGSTWSDESYGSGKTMCSASCGASSMAMLATVAADKDILPTDVRNLLGGSYYWGTSGSGMSALDKKVGDKYGFEVVNVPYTSLDDAEQKMKQYLDDGYMLHFSGAGSYPFSSGGHYIGVFGWTDKTNNKVMLANSGGYGNREENLHDVIYAGLHGGSFSAIKRGDGSDECETSSKKNICPTNDDDDSTSSTSSSTNNVLAAVEEIIKLANQNGSTYTWGGGHAGDASIFDAMLSGSPINVDCTGFASLVMYKAFGQITSFSSESIFGDSMYEEVPRSDVKPGDIFAYNSPQGHGGIVIEAQNGVVTKIAETGGMEGRSGNNNNIGYSGSSDSSVVNANSENGHFFRHRGV